MKVCRYCGEKFPEEDKEHDCVKAGRVIRQDDHSCFASSFMWGMLLGIPFFGGNLAGGLLGMAVHDSMASPAPVQAPDPIDTYQPPAPEPVRSYDTIDTTPAPDYSPSPSSSWSGSDDSSSSGSSDSGSSYDSGGGSDSGSSDSGGGGGGSD